MSREFVYLDEIASLLGCENIIPGVNLNEIRVYHRSINRPGFQLTGFYEHFESERIQIFGKAENKYLATLSKEEREKRLDVLFSTKFPALIVAHGKEPSKEVIDAGTKYKVPVLTTDMTTALVIVNIMAYINEQLAPTMEMHGVLVDVFGEGILIKGESGIGKSETAIELIKRGHRLVADDVIDVKRISEGRLIGSAPEITRHFVELRGIGVVDVKSLYGVESVKTDSPISMIINLEEWDGSNSYDRLGLQEDYEDILDVKVVKYTVPIRPGRNLAIIIETAAVNHRQKMMGYNSAEELCARLSKEIEKHNKEINEEDNEK